MYTQYWQVHLLDINEDRWESYSRKLQLFLSELSFFDIKAEIVPTQWDPETKEWAIRYIVTYQDRTESFYLRVDHPEEPAMIPSYLSMGDYFKLGLRGKEKQEMGIIFNDFYLEYVKSNVSMPAIPEKPKPKPTAKPEVKPAAKAAKKEPVLAKENFQDIVSHSSLSWERITKPIAALIHSLDQSADCFVFTFTPTKTTTVDPTEINTWKTHGGAPLLKFYRQVGELQVPYTFEEGKSLQLVYLDHQHGEWGGNEYAKFYWYDHHMWYRANVSSFAALKTHLKGIGKIHKNT